MKYYQYISDSKVDMLLPQIPYAFKQKVSGELGFDIKIISAKVKAETATLEDRVSRVMTVADYIIATQPVGTVEAPDTWIKGTHVVKHGFLAHGTKAVGFSGHAGDTSFLLAGSSAHLIGSVSTDAEIGQGFSYVPRLLENLKSAIEFSEKNALDDKQLAFYLGKDTGDTKEHNWRQLIHDGDYKLTETIKVEFLAKRLMQSDREGKQTCLLASPLYVAMVD